MSKAAFAGLKAVQEIRFHLCQTSKGSEGVRNFLLKSYKNMKAASPATPILIREASGVEGGIVVRQGTHTSDPAGVLAHRVVEPSLRDPRVAPRRCPPTIHPIKCPLCLTKVPIRPPSSQTLGWRRRLLSRVWTRRRWKRRSPRSSSKLAPFLVPLGRDRLVEGPPRETLDDVILLLFTTPPRSVRFLWCHRAIHVPRLTGPEGLGCVWDRTHRQRGESNG